LTRDRRGNEHTFLMHADVPGQPARVLYWYRTAPAVTMGRPPLDEDAIRLIEEQHPGIEFDWPAILALSEVMTPEDEPQAERQPRRPRPTGPRERLRVTPAAPAREAAEDAGERDDESAEPAPPHAATTFGLLEQLVGREIATRLRARHAEILSRIHAHPPDDVRVPVWLSHLEALDPDLWLTPEAVLAGVERADRLYEAVRRELHAASPGRATL
jgi:hypothetical protein